MENKVIQYSDFINESIIEIEGTEEGVYVLTLHDIHNIVNSFTDSEVDEDTILEELQDYKFVKIEDPSIKDGTDMTDMIKNEPSEEKPIEELSSDDENPNFIKKFEEL